LTETIPSLVLGFITLVHLPDTPAEAAWLTVEERQWLTRRLDTEKSRRGSPHRVTVLRALTSSRVLALSLCYFGVEIGLYGVILWIPQIFANAGIAAANVGNAVAIPYATAAIGMVWWSRPSDRLKERVWHIAAASVIAFLGLAASAWLVNSPLLSVVAMGNVGGFAGPFAIGWIKDATGSFTWGLLAVAGSVLLTGILAVLIGHDSAAEHGDPIDARGLRALGRKSANGAAGRAA